MPVDKVAGTLIVLALILIALSLMFVSWQRRRRRDIVFATSSSGSNGSTHSAAAEPRLIEVRGFYVATTPTDQPLERLAIPGLAFRARATVGVSRDGISLEPTGELETFISRDQLVGVRASDATIDRSAGRGSLTALDWIAANGAAITSVLRIPNRLDRNLFVDTVEAALLTNTSPSKEQS